MERFDDWVTDPELTLEKVRVHTDDPDRVGKKLLGKYTVTISSGSTGRRAFFVMSDATRTTAFTVARGRVPLMLNFRTADGRIVALSSLVVSPQVVSAAGVELFQIIQTTPSALRVRLQLSEGADPDRVWHEVSAKLAHMLSDHKLSHVVVERGTEPPLVIACSSANAQASACAARAIARSSV
ncbi:MAG: hypothetical protein ACRDTG_05395 [Pseudonocardiaceae bacterium]